VEDCLSIDANRWTREGILRASAHAVGSWRWTYPSGTGFTVYFDVNTRDLSRPSVRLWYSWVWTATQQQESADYRVNLTTTHLRFGGLRWWFVCPLVVNDRPCNRRVGKLYLPPVARYFGCRHCHELTYRSVQEHDKRVDFLRKHPEAIEALLDTPGGASVTQLGLALRALRPARRNGV
jgi:hypothetical protein